MKKYHLKEMTILNEHAFYIENGENVPIRMNGKMFYDSLIDIIETFSNEDNTININNSKINGRTLCSFNTAKELKYNHAEFFI